MVDGGGEFSFFQVILCWNLYNNWYLNFHKTYDHQIWQADTSIGFDSNEYNQAGTGDVIMSRSLDKLKTYLHYQRAYGHQSWQDDNLPWWALVHKVTDLLVTLSSKITWQTKLIISPLPQCLWPPHVAGW